MNSNLVFDIPEKLNQIDAHKLIEDIRLKKPTTILFDWTKCDKVDKMALCLILNLILESEQNNIKVTHSSHEKNKYYKEIIYPFISFPTQSLEVQESNLGAFLAGVEDDAILSRVIAMKEYLRSLHELDLFNINPLETIFLELYMNICQHSWKNNGIVFVAIEPENHIIELIISDIGVGIPANIRESFSAYEEKTDADAILYATEDLITTKSIEQNYGRGLSTLKTSVIALDGSATIYSGYGGLIIEKNGIALKSYEQHNNGTQIHIRIDFRNFEVRSDFDFTEDVEF